MKIKGINANKFENKDFYLTEQDFYPPQDNRIFKTYIEELYDDDFAEYTEYIFDLYENEDYYEN